MVSSGGHQDWVRLGVEVRDRREALDYTQDALYAAGGPSTVTQRTVESGRATGLKRRTITRYERVLRWGAGSFERVLSGRNPILLGDDDEPADQPTPVRPVGPEVAAAVETLRGLRSVIGAAVFDQAVDELRNSSGQPHQSGHTERGNVSG